MPPKKKPVPASDFSGMCRSVICVDNNGWKNFKIVTLIIEKGVVVKEFRSDPYLSFEAIEKLDLINDYAQIRLNMAWEKDKAWFLKTDKEGNLMPDAVSG